MKVKIGLLVVLLLVLLAMVIVAGSCLRGLAGEPMAIWTPAPAMAGTARAASGAAILPTQPNQRAQPTRPPAPPRATATPDAGATLDPKLIIITEADVLNAVAAGVGSQQGLALDGLGIKFTEGQMRLTADRLSYGPAVVSDLVLVGSLFAQDGRLQLKTESISPGGLVTSLIPAFANQALAQYAAQWYVEDVRTLDGLLELRIR